MSNKKIVTKSNFFVQPSTQSTQNIINTILNKKVTPMNYGNYMSIVTRTTKEKMILGKP